MSDQVSAIASPIRSPVYAITKNIGLYIKYFLQFQDSLIPHSNFFKSS